MNIPSICGGRLQGQVALITGAGRGIGRETAELFAREGASVVIATRTESHGRAALQAIQAANGHAVLLVLDLRTRDAARKAISTAVEQFGKLDIVIHNAASMPFGMVWDTNDAALDDTIDVNLKSAFWLTAEALPSLKTSSRPSILVVSS